MSLAWLSFLVLAKEPPRPSGPPPRGIFTLLEEADARWLCLFYMTTFGGFVGLANYLPIYFTDHFDVTKVAAGGYAAICAIAGSLLRPFGGAISDRIGGTRVLLGVLGLVAVSGLVLASLPGLSPTVVLLFATLGALGVGNGAVFQLVPQRFPDRVGQMTGLVGAAGGVGGFLLPFGLGALAEVTGGFAVGFAVFAVAAATAAALVRSRQVVWRTTWTLGAAV